MLNSLSSFTTEHQVEETYSLSPPLLELIFSFRMSWGHSNFLYFEIASLSFKETIKYCYCIRTLLLFLVQGEEGNYYPLSLPYASQGSPPQP